MLSAILAFFGAVFGFLGGLLPESPFRQLLGVTEQLRMGISWLNYFVPIDTFVTMFGLWLAACVAYIALRVFIHKLLSVLPGSVNGGYTT